MLASCCRGTTTKHPPYPLAGIPNRLWCGYDIERGRTRASLFEVAYPELRTCKLPLDIGTFLLTKTDLDKGICMYYIVPNPLKSIDRSDSSWRSANSVGQLYWSQSRCQTSACPRNAWRSWCHPTQNYPDLWVRRLPKTTSEWFQKDCGNDKVFIHESHFDMVKNLLWEPSPDNASIWIVGAIGGKQQARWDLRTAFLFQISVVPSDMIMMILIIKISFRFQLPTIAADWGHCQRRREQERREKRTSWYPWPFAIEKPAVVPNVDSPKICRPAWGYWRCSLHWKDPRIWAWDPRYPSAHAVDLWPVNWRSSLFAPARDERGLWKCS